MELIKIRSLQRNVAKALANWCAVRQQRRKLAPRVSSLWALFINLSSTYAYGVG